MGGELLTRLFRGGPVPQLEEIDRVFAEILTLSSLQVQEAVTALVAHRTDADIDYVMQRRQDDICAMVAEIRRRLLVHAGVRGRQVDLPLLLIWMSVTKDADRIAHLAINLRQLSGLAADLDRGALTEIGSAGELLTSIISELPANLAQRHTDTASDLLHRIGEELATQRNRTISATQAGSSEDVLAVGLSHRHLAAMLEHAGNVVASVTLPADRLDHWGELA